MVYSIYNTVVLSIASIYNLGGIFTSAICLFGSDISAAPQSVVTGGNGGVTIRVGSETEVCGILV